MIDAATILEVPNQDQKYESFPARYDKIKANSNRKIKDKILSANKDNTDKKTEYCDNSINSFDKELEQANHYGFQVLSYQNWQGKIINIDGKDVKAYLTETNNRHAPRYVVINIQLFKKFHCENKLKTGAKFNWTFKRIKKASKQICNIENVEFIEPFKLSQGQINHRIKRDLESLSFLFKK